MQGIPVIFIEIETALGSNPYLAEYRRFHRRCEEQKIQDPTLTPELCKGYEHFVTVLHEIRHFHDALLCRPLFERFLLRNQISWCLAQIIPRIPAGVERIPIDWNNRALTTAQDIQDLRQLSLAFDEQYFHKFGGLLDPCILQGQEITLDHLIETNAIVTELLQLYVVHGPRSTRDYYLNTISVLTDSKYTLLIDLDEVSIQFKKALALAALYFSIPYCLCSSRNPTQAFCRLVKNHEHSPRSIFVTCNPTALKGCFNSEASLKRDVESTMFFQLDGQPIEPRWADVPDKQFAESLFSFHETMYRCREKLINKYIGEFAYNAGHYCERLDELPIPPMLFFPEITPNGTAKGVFEEEFTKRHQVLYTIAAHPGNNPSNPVVFAGMTNVLPSEPAISFAIADLHLVYAYFYNAAFQGKTSLYSPIVDHMYEQVMRTISHEAT